MEDRSYGNFQQVYDALTAKFDFLKIAVGWACNRRELYKKTVKEYNRAKRLMNPDDPYEVYNMKVIAEDLRQIRSKALETKVSERKYSVIRFERK
jgi:hypothetical protein